MEATKEVIKEKKPKVPRVKKEKVDKLVIVKESGSTDLESQNKETKDLHPPNLDSTIKEEVKEIEKEEVILSFDPGFKKMGVAIITTKTGDYVESYTVAVRPEGKLN